MALHYLIGDATDPIKKPAIIMHVCNDCRPGKWGAGFVMALSKKNVQPERHYRKWAEDGNLLGVPYTLGKVQLAPFADDVCVANIIGQHGTKFEGKIPPVRYWAIREALKKLYPYAKKQGMSVHAPRFGAALAGGSWEEIEYIIKDTMGDVETYIYTLPSEKADWPGCVYENDTDEINNSSGTEDTAAENTKDTSES